MPIKATTVDGTEVEVELPEGYVAPDDIRANYVPKQVMERELARRAAGMARKQLDEMLTDDGQRAELLAKLGIDPDAGSRKAGKPDGDAVAKLRGEWEAKELAPLRKELETRDAYIRKARERALVSDIVTAAQAVGFKPEFLKPPAPGAQPPVVAMFGNLFGHDADSDGYFVRDGDGFAYSAKPSASQPFKTVQEFFAEFAGTKDAAPFLGAEPQRGAGYRGANENRGSGGPIRLARSDARDASKYRQAKAMAEKMGVELELVDG